MPCLSWPKAQSTKENSSTLYCFLPQTATMTPPQGGGLWQRWSSRVKHQVSPTHPPSKWRLRTPVPLGPGITYSHSGSTRRGARHPWHHLAHFIWDKCVLINTNQHYFWSLVGVERFGWINWNKQRNRHHSISTTLSLLTLVFQENFGVMLPDEPTIPSLLCHPIPLTRRLKELQEPCCGHLSQKVWHHLPREKLGIIGWD